MWCEKNWSTKYLTNMDLLLLWYPIRTLLNATQETQFVIEKLKYWWTLWSQIAKITYQNSKFLRLLRRNYSLFKKFILSKIIQMSFKIIQLSSVYLCTVCILILVGPLPINFEVIYFGESGACWYTCLGAVVYTIFMIDSANILISYTCNSFPNHQQNLLFPPFPSEEFWNYSFRKCAIDIIYQRAASRGPRRGRPGISWETLSL